ncbi:MAG: type II secretion system F family protein [Actinomycetota bacterium]
MIPAIGAVLVVAGVFSVVWAANARSARRLHNLREVLDMVYEDGDTQMSSKELSTLLARAGVVAERAFGSTSIAGRVVSKIDRSDWQVGPGEFLAISVAGAIGGFLLGAIMSSIALSLLLGGVGLAAPTVYVNRSVEKRRTRFEEQFPDVLDLIGASLESGSSMAQALELVVSEADDPAASEFSRVLSATRLGSPLIDALKAMAERVGSRDLDWTVQAIIVQQRTGGRLADILHTVAEFMRGREEIRREIKALTAEGRLSAIILGSLPFFLGGAILMMNPDYLDPLFESVTGIVMMLGSLVLLLIGFFVMSRMVKIEV